MLNRWLARFKIDPDTLRQQKWFALFGERLLAPALWQGGTRALCGAVAAGLFASPEAAVGADEAGRAGRQGGSGGRGSIGSLPRAGRYGCVDRNLAEA